MSRSLKIIVIFIFSYLTTMLFSINVNFEHIVIDDNLFVQIRSIISDFDVIQIIVGFIIYFYYYSIFFDGQKYTRKNVLITILSVVLAVLITIGKHLELSKMFPNLSNFVVLFETSTMFFGSYLVFYSVFKKIINSDFSIVLSDDKPKNVKKSKKKSCHNFVKKVIEFVRKHPFFSVFILIFICRIPYMILYYPASGNADTYDQLCQFFNRSCSWTKGMTILANKNVYLNNHHPFFSTFYLGFFVKIGLLFNSMNFGLFLYALFQSIISSLIFAYLLLYMKKLNVPFVFRLISLLLICFLPIFPAYAIFAVKDTPQALFTLLYVIFLLKIVRDYDSVFSKKIVVIFFIFIMLFTMLFRHNGIMTILFSFPLLFFLYKNKWKQLLIVLLVPIVIYISFNQIMYRCLDASKGSRKEVLSAPFMQVTRLMAYEGLDVVSKKDRATINKVLNYKKSVKYYYPDLADGVKDLYNNETTNRELLDFFGVWFKYFLKYPNVYIQSFINSTYQYFYPYETYQNVSVIFDPDITVFFPSIHPITKFDNVKRNYNYFLEILQELPFIGLIFKVAFYDWILILSTCYVVYKKKYKYLIPLMALLSVLLVCLASPINGSMRYILPILFSFPVILSIDYLVYKESE